MRVTDKYSLSKRDAYNFEVEEKIPINKNHPLAKGDNEFKTLSHFFATPELALRFILRHSIDFEDAEIYLMSIDGAMTEIATYCENLKEE